jgi:replicative DNA helicase
MAQELIPLKPRTVPGTQNRRNYLKSFSELFEKLAPGGLVPPQDVGVEQSLLGAMMIDVNSAYLAMQIIGDRWIDNSPFYRDNHTVIYRAMVNLDARSEKVDLLTVTNQLRLDGFLDHVGGPSYLVELTTQVVTTVNVESHARIILEHYIARESIRIFEEGKLRMFDGQDAFEVLDAAQTALFQLSEIRHHKSFYDPGKLAMSTIKMLDQIKNRQDGLTGITTGLMDLDSITTGWQRTDLIVLAARPSQGKTALALHFARATGLNPDADLRAGVAIFSLEMGAEQLMLRLICADAKVDMQRARKGQLEDEEWRAIALSAGKISASHIFIDDTPAITVLEIRAKARRLKSQKNIGLIIVDYLQLMSAGRNMESREREISMISRSLKALAKELNIPVIALSQLNRGVETRGDKRPVLSDLRESGAIEQDADTVLFIYRAETYGLENTMIRGQSISSDGVAELIIGKQRSGPIGEVGTAFLKQYGRFENLSLWPEFQGQPKDVPMGTPAF